MRTKIYLQHCLLSRQRLACILSINQRRNFAAYAYVQNVGREPLIYCNLGTHFLQRVERYGDRTAIVSSTENKSYTFNEALAEAEKLAVKLKELGLERGQHLGIWAPNTTQWYITYLAGIFGGYPLVCLNPALQGPEIEYALKKAKVQALITMDECGKLKFSDILNQLFKRGAGSKLPALRLILVEGGDEQQYNHIKTYNYEKLMNKPYVLDKDFKELKKRLTKIKPESAVNLQFTSGTTGLPKAIILTHFNMVNECRYFGRSMEMEKFQRRVCLTVPFFHVFGLGVATAAFDYGATLVLPSPTFNAAAALDTIAAESCDLMLGTPTMFVDMLQQQRKNPRAMKHVKMGLVGGATCSPEVFQQAKQVFGLEKMRVGYGMTEATATIFTHNGTESEEIAPQTVGKLYEHLEAKVINKVGETVAFGESGELCVRGFSVMQGYFEDEARTKEVLSSEGWLKTGDEFILEPNGVGYIVGRKKDVIMRGGECIFPKEIEDCLDTHESILETQVIGVPDNRLGEVVCVYLRLVPGAKPLTVEDIRNFCNGKLAYFKIPSHVRIIEELPKTNSGKIQKFKLREMFKNSL